MYKLFAVLALAVAAQAQNGDLTCDEVIPLLPYLNWQCFNTSSACGADNDCTTGYSCSYGGFCFSSDAALTCNFVQGPFCMDVPRLLVVPPAIYREQRDTGLTAGFVLKAQYAAYRKLDRPGAKCTYTRHYRKYRAKERRPPRAVAT